jgi:hypothetical protein
MKRNRRILLGALLITGLLAMGAGINESVRVDSGEVHDGDLSTVNGGIKIGDNATINGDAESVNGGVDVGENCRVEGLGSVNGGVSVGAGTAVAKKVEAVNGRIVLERGVTASGVATINGRIKMTGAEIAGDVSTINGDISLRESSTIGGDIVVKARGKGSNDRDRPLQIELEDGSVVEGNILVEDETIPVEVHLGGGSRVMGRIENAEVIEN